MTVTILIIDDSKVEHLALGKHIQKADINVNIISAYDGTQGLEALRFNTIDIIFCDINMPNMDGIQFISEIKAYKEFKNIPIAVITSETSNEKLRKILTQGVDDLIPKPYKSEDITNFLKKFTLPKKTS